MASPQVSIIIPTRHRADTLAICLRTVVAQDYDKIEVIVSNNGADPATRDVVGRMDDPRVRCVEPDGLLSMSHNFEFGLSHATGDWLVVIGDDDGILPGGLRRGLEILAESGAEALASPTCLYQWPVPGEERAGTFLTIPMGRGWRWRSSAAAIPKMLNRDIGFNAAPITYTGGIIGAALFRRIKQIKGSFFQSQIPDCFSAFAICSATERYVLSNEPLMVAGISRHSHGRISLAAEPNAFNSYDNIPFHPAIPQPDSGALTSSFQAMLYESYLQTDYLRSTPPITDMREQIVAILAYARCFRRQRTGANKAAEIAEAWARRAAAHYQYDFDSIDRDAARLPLKAQLSQQVQKVQDFLSRYAIGGGSGEPVDDVFEACRVASDVLQRRPNRLPSYARAIARRLRQA